MTAEDFRETVQRAMGKEVAEGTDPDEIEAVFDEMLGRLDHIRVLNGEPEP